MDAALITKANIVWSAAAHMADYDPALAREQNAAAAIVYRLAIGRNGVEFDRSGNRVTCKQHQPEKNAYNETRDLDGIIVIHTCANCGAVLAVE